MIESTFWIKKQTEEIEFLFESLITEIEYFLKLGCLKSITEYILKRNRLFEINEVLDLLKKEVSLSILKGIKHVKLV